MDEISRPKIAPFAIIIVSMRARNVERHAEK